MSCDRSFAGRMCTSRTLIVTSIIVSSSSSFSIGTNNLLEMRISHLENEFDSTKILLSEVLSEVQKVKNISAYYLRKDDIKKISDSNEINDKLESLAKNINNAKDTKDEFSSFKLMMARDVCHLKVTFLYPIFCVHIYPNKVI